jgi:hypothetical protein
MIWLQGDTTRIGFSPIWLHMAHGGHRKSLAAPSVAARCAAASSPRLLDLTRRPFVVSCNPDSPT